MKPKDLPFYENGPVISPFCIEEKGIGLLESNISRARVFTQEHSEPLQNAWHKANTALRTAKEKADHMYSGLLENTQTLQNATIITASAGAGWGFNIILFPKSGFIRRWVTPVAFGSLAATFCYPDTAMKLTKDSAKFVKEKVSDMFPTK